MKKIITLLLLLIFCVEPASWATEIIVGADGQARYAGDVGTPVQTKTILQTEAPKQIETPVQTKTVLQTEYPKLIETPVQTKTVLQTEYPKLIETPVQTKTVLQTEYPKLIETPIAAKKELEKNIKPYEKKNKEIIKKAKRTIDYQKVSSNIVYLQEHKDSSYVKTFQLQDGDYALWSPSKKNVQYAAEFHKDDSGMGIVEIKKLNSKTVVFYEYRSESAEAKTAPLKHIMIAYSDKHNAAFIYTFDNQLRICQYDNKTYAIDMPSMPALQEVDFSKIKTQGQESVTNSAENVARAAGIAVAAPLIAATSPLIILGMAVCIIGFINAPHY